MNRTGLRTGFTTGSAAAAAVKAALLVWAGRPLPGAADIPLPTGGRLRVPLESAEILEDAVRVSVIKDAGDDPDITHRARIRATVRLEDPSAPTELSIQGGPGVGQVTKPGLAVPVGEPAINPAPRDQIRRAGLEAVRDTGLAGRFQALIEVPDGKRLAAKTMNPRLGIHGGISILGTRGTVQPFSSASYKGTIESELDVARAAGCRSIGFATGGRSERCLRGLLPDRPAECFVLTADYFAFSLEQAVARGFQAIHLGCFYGKLVKMAQGHPYTHARSARLDFNRLARWCAECGLPGALVHRVRGANTARETLELIRESALRGAILEAISGRALGSARRFAGARPDLELSVFDFEGGLLVQARSAGAAYA